MALRLDGLSVTNPNGLNAGSPSSSSPASAFSSLLLLLVATIARAPLRRVQPLRGPREEGKATVLRLEAAGTELEGGRRESGEEAEAEVEQGQPDMAVAAVAGAWIDGGASGWWWSPAECGREAKCFGWLSGAAAREPRERRFSGLPWARLSVGTAPPFLFQIIKV
jgi:hypothetical protein